MTEETGGEHVARGRRGVRVAVIGKGGAGKTVVCATLARMLARRGRRVLAADLDANPGLSLSLGLDLNDGGLPREALEEHGASPYGWRLSSDLRPEDAVERFAAIAPEGVRFLGLGKFGASGTLRPNTSITALLAVLRGFHDPGWDVIGDLEGGLTTPFEHYHDFADDVIVVVGPAWASAMTARRLLPLVGDRHTIVVANRFQDEPDHPGLAPSVRIPFDPALAEAERQGLSPLDACPDSPAVRAVGALADQLLSRTLGPSAA